MTYLDFLEQKVLLERLVIGLEEPVLIKGLGELSAKIDSGNGGYNVIHGTDFHQQGSELMFTTHDSFGHEKKMQAKVIDTIEVNMGGGNIESRPVIELDIKFAGEDYKKIPFSVSDRSSNTNPILISKGFVENELEALIDVGAMNISHEGIDVVYGESVVTEGILSGVWNATKGIGNGLWDATKGVAKAGASAIANAGEILHGQKGAFDGVKAGLKQGKEGIINGAGNVIEVGKQLGALGILGGAAALKKISRFASDIANHDNLLKKDKENIINSLSSCNFITQLSKNKEVNVDRTLLPLMASGSFNKWQVLHVCNYLCEKSDKKEVIEGLQQRRKDFKKLIKKAKEAVKELKSGNQNQGQQMGESFSLLEALILLEQDDTTGTPDNNTTGTSTPVTSNDTQVDSNSQQGNSESQPSETQTDNTDYQGITTSIEELQNFSLWFIPFGKQYNTDNKFAAYTQKYIQDFFMKDDKTLIKLFNLGTVSVESTRKVIKEIAAQLNKKTASLETANEYQGFFALVTGNERKVKFYEFLDCTSYVRSNSSIQGEEDAKNKEQVKQNVIEKLNEIGELNKQFNLQQFDVTEPDDSEYKDVLSIIQSNPNELPMSYKLFDYARKHANDDKVRTQALAKLNTVIKSEYPMYLLRNSELGKQILSILGNNYKWNGYDNFISTCLENEDIKNLLLAEQQPAQQQQEDAWIENKLNHFREQGII